MSLIEWVSFLGSHLLLACGMVVLVDGFKFIPSGQLHIIKHIELYPFNYITSPSVLDVPPCEDFYNHLTFEHITESLRQNVLPTTSPCCWDG